MRSSLTLAGAGEIAARAAVLADRLPPLVKPLAAVAYNFHWSWTRSGGELFREIDPHRWRLSSGNPVRFLADLSPAAVSSLAERPDLGARIAALVEEHAAYMAAPERDAGAGPAIFLCAEFGFHASIQIYSGGLGVLAGDMLKEASDQAFPMIGIGLLYRRGYFRQRLDVRGRQQEYWLEVDPDTLPMAPLTGDDGSLLELEVTVFGRTTYFHVWRVDVGRVPLFLLDAEHPRNDAVQRWTTARLYDGNRDVRLAQYGLLGMGAARLLRAIGVQPYVLHLNEGHPALAALELAAQKVEGGVPVDEALEQVPQQFVFTTHTPVPAGNETYPPQQFLDAYRDLPQRLGIDDDRFLGLCRMDPANAAEEPSMSPLAIRMSRTRNGVSALHGEVARQMWAPMFPEADPESAPITHVTNGAHAPTFVGEPMYRLLARHLGDDWLAAAADAERWEVVRGIPNSELWAARCESRAQLIAFARSKSEQDRLLRGERLAYVRALEQTLEPHVLTLGFARRLAIYKRLYLLTHDIERARAILEGPNPVQLLVAGKAHPNDEAGKETLQRLYKLRREDGEMAGRVVFIEDYDLEIARRLVAGCDVWMNLPRRPMEASGTSGMKATFNGVLQLSVLDGWWAEAYDGSNGWAIPGDEDPDPAVVDERDAAVFYELLEQEVIPAFYERDENDVPQRWCERIKSALVTCAPRFSSTRMLDEYRTRIYAAD